MKTNINRVCDFVQFVMCASELRNNRVNPSQVSKSSLDFLLVSSTLRSPQDIKMSLLFIFSFGLFFCLVYQPLQNNHDGLVVGIEEVFTAGKRSKMGQAREERCWSEPCLSGLSGWFVLNRDLL
jgi:hypothetical protein